MPIKSVEHDFKSFEKTWLEFFQLWVKNWENWGKGKLSRSKLSTIYIDNTPEERFFFLSISLAVLFLQEILFSRALILATVTLVNWATQVTLPHCPVSFLSWNLLLKQSWKPEFYTLIHESTAWLDQEKCRPVTQHKGLHRFWDMTDPALCSRLWHSAAGWLTGTRIKKPGNIWLAGEWSFLSPPHSCLPPLPGPRG